MLNKCRKWKLGKGDSIDFWDDDWLGIGSIRSLVHDPLSPSEVNLKVGDFIIENVWNLEILSLELPDYIMQRIHALSIAFHRTDTPFFSVIENDKFYLSIMYNEMVRDRSSKSGSEWLWKLEIPPKIRLFLWLLWWDRIPQSYLLHQRNIIPSPMCPSCPTCVESSLHVIRDCTKVSAIWCLLSPPPVFWLYSNIKEWLHFCVSSQLQSNGLNWSLLFPVVCFEIWKARNRSFFDKKPHMPTHATQNLAMNMAKEFRAAQSSPITNPSVKCTSWGPSPHPFVHIHVDASFMNIETRASMAGVIRDSLGGWLLGFFSLSYALNPYHAELLAIKQGLEMARSKHFTHVALVSDCKKAVDIISGNSMQIDFYSDLIMDCRELRHYFQETSLTFVRREDNQVADMLAHECMSGFDTLDVIRQFPNPP